jgi:hypothetical protein
MAEEQAIPMPDRVCDLLEGPKMRALAVGVAVADWWRRGGRSRVDQRRLSSLDVAGAIALGALGLEVDGDLAGALALRAVGLLLAWLEQRAEGEAE